MALSLKRMLFKLKPVIRAYTDCVVLWSRLPVFVMQA